MVFDEHKYRYRTGRSFPVAAQVAGEELEKLGVYERPVPPSDVVKAAKPAAAPLHPCFEWNNSEAANLYRENQARELMRSIAVVMETRDESRPEKQIAFVSVGTSGPKGQPGYIATSVAMEDEDTRERVVRDAVSQLKGWQARYRNIEELADAVKAIDKVINKIAAPQAVPA